MTRPSPIKPDGGSRAGVGSHVAPARQISVERSSAHRTVPGAAATDDAPSSLNSRDTWLRSRRRGLFGRAF